MQEATQNFHEDNRLGVGSFGGVFKGIQHDGTEVAIKVLGLPDQAGFEEEVRVLSKFRHPNLVILMGFAKNGPERLLVYELLGGGDVFHRLQKCATENVPFPWKLRISAAYDASCGLSHLHNSTPKVFHRDIKCPNILLDRNGTAKMADFGLACCSHAKETKVQQAAGTVGYACPHYVSNSVVTERSEVYSFGIVLLELLTARPPASKFQAPDGSDQYEFLVTALGYNVRTAVQALDKKAGFPYEVALNFAHLGLKCTEYQEEHRPFFSEVVARLRELRDIQVEASPVLPPPPEPDVPPPPPQPSRGHQGYTSRGHQGGPQGPQGYQQTAAVQALHAQMLQQQQLQQLQQQQMMQSAQMAQMQRAQVANQATASAPFRVPQMGLTQAQEDELRLQYLTGQPVQPLRQVPVPMPELERYNSGGQLGQLAPAYGGSLLARRGVPHVRHPKKLAWTLECVMAQGEKLVMLSKDQKTLIQRREDNKSVPTQRFGRIFQREFLKSLLPDFLFDQVSREHFQIWALEWPALSDDGQTPHSFRLTNYATVGTSVDDLVLDERGQSAKLHHGSKIGLLRRVIVDGKEEATPFLEFYFSLEQSGLTDADVVYESFLTFCEPILKRTPDEMAPFEGEPTSPHDRVDSDMALEGFGVDVPGGISFVGDDVEPVFILEVGGTAVRAGGKREKLQVVHGPRKSACAAAPGCEVPCPPLVLGSAQAGFWCRILADKSNLTFLEPEHLMIEVDDAAEAAERRFFVRNLSTLPLRVQGPPEEESIRQEEDGKWQIHHGDTILLNLSKGTSMWMNFRAYK